MAYTFGDNSYYSFNYLNNNLYLQYLLSDGSKLILYKLPKIIKFIPSDDDENTTCITLREYEIYDDNEVMESTFIFKDNEYYISFSKFDYESDLPLIDKENKLVKVGFMIESKNDLRISTTVKKILDMDDIDLIYINSDKVANTQLDCHVKSFKDIYGENYLDILNLDDVYLIFINDFKTQIVAYDNKENKSYLFENNDIYLFDNNSNLKTTDNKLFLVFSNGNSLLVNDIPESFTKDMNYLQDKYFLIGILFKSKDNEEEDDNMKTVSVFHKLKLN